MKSPVDIDGILQQIGEFGKYQKLLLWLICLPAVIPCAFCAFNQLFMADVPPHWCAMPELSNLTMKQRRQLAIPSTEGSNYSRSACRRYAINWIEIAQNPDIENLNANTSWPTEACPFGFEYDTTEINSSVVIDFDLVCDYAIYPTISLVLLNAGSPFGVYLFGYLNDRFGRRFSFFTCLTTFILGNVFSAISPTYGLWTFFRFVGGLTVPAIYQIPFIIALEFVGPKYRTFVTFTTCVFYTLGLMLLAGITYFIRNWVNLTLATSLPFVLYYIYWSYLPESPRWLLAKGEHKTMIKILKHIAHVNNKPISNRLENLLKEDAEARTTMLPKRKPRSPKVTSLCKTPNMRLKTALITFNWFANITTYVGLCFYGPALGTNRYLSFFLSAIVELPAYCLCWIVMDKWGRKWPLCFSMVFSGVSSLATVLLSQDAVTETLVLFLIAKSAISSSLLIINPYAGELFPTELRGIGMGTVAYVGGLGLIAIPFITYLGQENLVLPLIILGVLSVIGGLSSLRLPETLRKPLPETLEEAEAFGKDLTFRNCFRCDPDL